MESSVLFGAFVDTIPLPFLSMEEIYISALLHKVQAYAMTLCDISI